VIINNNFDSLETIYTGIYDNIISEEFTLAINYPERNLFATSSSELMSNEFSLEKLMVWILNDETYDQTKIFTF
jgi:hypothetical protein